MDAAERPGLPIAEDVRDLVLDYCADGVEAFHSCVTGAIKASADGSEPEADTSKLLEQVLQGSRRLYESLAMQASSSMLLFKEACTASILKPPVRISTVQVQATRPPGGDAYGPGQGAVDDTEEALVDKISRLRQEICKVDQECAELQQEVQRADQHIATCGNASEYARVGSTVLSSKQTIKAIVQAACNLENLLERAAMQRSAHGRANAAGTHPLAGVCNVAALSTASVTELAALVGI